MILVGYKICLVPPPRIELGRGLTPLDFESKAQVFAAHSAFALTIPNYKKSSKLIQSQKPCRPQLCGSENASKSAMKVQRTHPFGRAKL
jgi:hypothetical protein